MWIVSDKKKQVISVSFAWAMINLILAREPRCLPLRPPPHGAVVYFFENETTSCREECFVGVTARLSCAEFYTPASDEEARCRGDGTWSPIPLRCFPVCGKRKIEVGLVVNGRSATPGSFPWHTAIYNVEENRREFWCSGSLVSEQAVLTAAHCTWNLSPKNLILGFGKLHRDMDFVEPHVQFARASKIEILDSYQDASGNYNDDLSVIFLAEIIELNAFVIPICIDWNQSRVDEHLKDGTLGTVPGWGLTEKETFSDNLKILSIPVASNARCIAEQERDFRKFITYTSFCAGFRNGTAVCNGDSGGGLAFWDKKSERWYLQGLVSVSPRRKGTPFCDPRFYTVFTKVSLFTKWLHKLGLYEYRRGSEKSNDFGNNKAESESDIKAFVESKKNASHAFGNQDPYALIRKYFLKSPDSSEKRNLRFPHTKEILKLIKTPVN